MIKSPQIFPSDIKALTISIEFTFLAKQLKFPNEFCKPEKINNFDTKLNHRGIIFFLLQFGRFIANFINETFSMTFQFLVLNTVNHISSAGQQTVTWQWFSNYTYKWLSNLCSELNFNYIIWVHTGMKFDTKYNDINFYKC